MTQLLYHNTEDLSNISSTEKKGGRLQFNRTCGKIFVVKKLRRQDIKMNIQKPYFMFSEEGSLVGCTFEYKGKAYRLPEASELRASFLASGLVPIFSAGDHKVDSDLLYKGKLPEAYKEKIFSDSPALLRLGFIHFIENFKGRVNKSKPVIDKLDLKELAEFGVRSRNSVKSLRKLGELPYTWEETVKKVWNTTL